MTVTLEQIEMLRERAQVSYEEARDALQKCNGDIVEALIYLEKQDKINKQKPPSANTSQSGFWDTIKGLFKKCNETNLVISKNHRNIIDLSLTIVIIATIILPPLTFFGLLAALFTGYKIRLEKPGGEDMQINKTLDDISKAATKVSEQVTDAINKK